jgi:hypothetical protein
LVKSKLAIFQNDLYFLDKTQSKLVGYFYSHIVRANEFIKFLLPGKLDNDGAVVVRQEFGGVFFNNGFGNFSVEFIVSSTKSL